MYFNEKSLETTGQGPILWLDFVKPPSHQFQLPNPQTLLRSLFYYLFPKSALRGQEEVTTRSHVPNPGGPWAWIN